MLVRTTKVQISLRIGTGQCLSYRVGHPRKRGRNILGTFNLHKKVTNTCALHIDLLCEILMSHDPPALEHRISRTLESQNHISGWQFLIQTIP